MLEIGEIARYTAMLASIGPLITVVLIEKGYLFNRKLKFSERKSDVVQGDDIKMPKTVGQARNLIPGQDKV